MYITHKNYITYRNLNFKMRDAKHIAENFKPNRLGFSS